jgi:GrxB family glutaredoxin
MTNFRLTTLFLVEAILSFFAIGPLIVESSTPQSALKRVIPSPLPKLYVYDHCPFCVRVRLAFGLKNIKHELIFLANDDVDTPTKLVGKKIAPIYSFKDVTMPESLDIIAKIDSDATYGPTGYFKPFSGRADLKNWQNAVADANRLLQRPRYMQVPLPEFHQRDAKNAFVKNHPIPPFEKPEWAKLSSAEQWKEFENAKVKSDELIDEINEALIELDKLIYSTSHCTEGGLSLDDIDLWSRLRSLTLVKGLNWPAKLRNYMDSLSIAGDIPLYDSMAC